MGRGCAMALAALGLAAVVAVPGAQGIDDLTPPVVSFNIVGTKGGNGWYTSNVTVSWSFTDPESGIRSWSGGCNSTTLVSDTAGTPLTCSVANHADVSTSVGVTIKIDKTAPTVTRASPERTPDSGEWYTRPLTVTFEGTDPTSGLEGCSAVSYGGPDSANASVSGVCRDRAGNVSAQASFGFRFDKTAPTVMRASPERAPDSGQWYRRPLTVSFEGTDPISGLEGCSAVSYGGPDSATASVSGVCRDRAGNVSAQASFGFRFDKTAPDLAQVAVEAGSHVATVRWNELPAWESVTIRRSPGRGDEKVSTVYRGGGRSFIDRSVRNGVKYTYVVVASDPASNSERKTVEALPKGPLRAPAEAARVGAPPLLRWVKVRKASFYNVQLFRKGRKILSAWPVQPRLRLRQTWVWNGRRRTLVPGKYRWFVWPAYKRGGKIRYGRSLGHSDFVVPARAG